MRVKGVTKNKKRGIKTMDKNIDYILKKIAKILVPYDNSITTNKMIFDIVDDINDVFKGFTNMYHDAFYDDDNNNNNNN